MKHMGADSYRGSEPTEKHPLVHVPKDLALFEHWIMRLLR